MEGCRDTRPFPTWGNVCGLDLGSSNGAGEGQVQEAKDEESIAPLGSFLLLPPQFSSARDTQEVGCHLYLVH